jgi:ribose 5-phosphate isomerase A
MTQNELKQAVARKALDYVQRGEILGVGTGSTVNFFIDALAEIKGQIKGALSSSEASTERLRAHGIAVLDPNEVERIGVYIDGADEIDHAGCMIKGGGKALTREKIIAQLADRFVCIADGSKLVPVLGGFALPVEIIPMARAQVQRVLNAMGGDARWREGVVTDNAAHILDVHGLKITNPRALELEINQIPGVITVGLFAKRGANTALIGREATGVEVMNF